MQTTASWALELADRHALRERLATTCELAPDGRERITVGVLAGARSAIASAGGRSAIASAAARSKDVSAGARDDDESALPDARFPVRTGCLTKLFTATLARQACAAGDFALGDRVADLLEPRTALVLAGIKVRHLLEHTHGLDDSLLDAAPRRSGGFIDAERLANALGAAGRLSDPGELYSYSNSGAWLLAALLERASGRRYAELLHERLFAPSAIGWAPGPSAAAVSGTSICAAVGRSLSVSLDGMLAFLRDHALAPDVAPVLERAREGREIVPLPGWNVLERGVCLGWKYHGAGWFGHASVWPEGSALVRVQPGERVALVVVSTGRPAFAVAACLFGARLPELAALHIPLPLRIDQFERLGPTHAYVGTYRSARWSVTIASAGGGRLELHALRRNADGSGCGPRLQAPLEPAENGVFFTGPPTIEEFPYVQFVTSRDGGFQHLWNGRYVLRRCRPAAGHH